MITAFVTGTPEALFVNTYILVTQLYACHMQKLFCSHG